MCRTNRIVFATFVCVMLLAPGLYGQRGRGSPQPDQGRLTGPDAPVRRAPGTDQSEPQPARLATGALLSSNRVSFAVHGSQIGSGVWKWCGLRARAGDWILVETEVLEALDSPNLPDGCLLAGMKAEPNPPCRFEYKSGKIRKGDTQRLAFQAMAAGRVLFATQNKVHLTVVMTVTNECPTGVAVADAASPLAGGAAVEGAVPCPHCKGTGLYTVAARPSRYSHIPLRNTAPCLTCKGTKWATPSQVEHYWKSLE